MRLCKVIVLVVFHLAHTSSLSLSHHRGLNMITSTTITPQFLQQFCTLDNFQKCIGEIWPNPVGQSDTKTKDKDNDDDEDNDNTTTLSSDFSRGGTRRKSSGTDFPTSFSELQATCQDLKERVRCLDRHSELCFTNAMLQVFGHIVSNAKQFVHDLCYNKKIQNGRVLVRYFIETIY